MMIRAGRGTAEPKQQDTESKRENRAQTARHAGPGVAWMKEKGTAKEEQVDQEAPESLVTKFCNLSLDRGGLENRVATSRMTRKGYIGG